MTLEEYDDMLEKKYAGEPISYNGKVVNLCPMGRRLVLRYWESLRRDVQASDKPATEHIENCPVCKGG